MNFYSTSRRDDMISLLYNLLFLLNNFKFPLYDKDIYNVDDECFIETFEEILKLK